MKQRGATPDEDRAMGWFEEGEVTRVKPAADGSGWAVTAGGWTCNLAATQSLGLTPKVGDTFTTFGQIGYLFHGQALNGQVLWYRSVEEEETARQEQTAADVREKHEQFDADRARLDADYDALPEPFRERINKFRATNPDFRWEYEAYELMCCTDAVKIAHHCWLDKDDEQTTADKILAFTDLPWEEQAKAGIDGGHSGNSFQFAVRLALLWVNYPARVIAEHGALTPLVGCAEYGCPHPEAPLPQPKETSR